MSNVVQCMFCQRLFEASEQTSIHHPACPRCQAAAKRNDFPGSEAPPAKQKKFVEGDGFFDAKDFLQEDKNKGFFEATEYHTESTGPR